MFIFHPFPVMLQTNERISSINSISIILLLVNFKLKMDIDVINRSQCFVNKKKVLNNIQEDSRNAFLSVTPSNLKFTFTSKNLKVQQKTIEITNYFSKSCPIQPLTLETHYFRIESISQVKNEFCV